jgi:hypothetical protein
VDLGAVRLGGAEGGEERVAHDAGHGGHRDDEAEAARPGVDFMN